MASSQAQDEFNELMRNKQRSSAHPEDGSAELHDEEQKPPLAVETVRPRQSMSSTRDTIPKMKYGANTGPKGVIADAQNFRDSRRTHRAMARASIDTTDIATEPGAKLGQQLEIERLTLVEERGDLDDDSDDMDDEFVTQWRQQRLQALRGGDYSSTIHDRGTSTGKKFGHLSTVDGGGYLEAIEESGAGVAVVVYISDDASELSQLFEGCLRSLANKYQKTRFVKLNYQEAEIQAEGVPGVIAYRDGDKFAAIIPLIDELPDDGDLDERTVEKVLQKHQILI